MNPNIVELSIPQLITYLWRPCCFWHALHGAEIPFVGGGESSHLRARARAVAPADPDYRFAVGKVFGHHLTRTGFSALAVAATLEFYDGLAEVKLTGDMDDCFFDQEGQTYVPVAWKIAGGSRKGLSREDRVKLHAYGLLAKATALVVEQAAVAYMIPNGSREPWNYQVEPFAVYPRVALRVLRKAAGTARQKNAPPASERCKKLGHVGAGGTERK